MKKKHLTLVIDKETVKKTAPLTMLDELHRQRLILEDIQRQVHFIAKAFSVLLKRYEMIPEIINILQCQRQDLIQIRQMLANHIKDPNAHSDTEKA